MKKFLFLAAALFLAVPTSAQAEKLKVDTVHSGISFKVRHFFSKVHGKFGEFKVKFNFNKGNIEKSRVTARIAVTSVDTNNKKRDGHLQGDDFFNAPRYPFIIFKSTSFKKTGEKTMDIIGNLTIRGVTKSVTLKATFNGSMVDKKKGRTIYGFSATTNINRHDFKVSYGRGVVGDQITINLDIAAIGK
ncbi:MAG: YceI family protein [Myxococcales bacterium]|nr:YceI family protein [Myxococcales bacterium]MCB9642332.1 YceI family protein [Myxococcales bacterium]